MCLCLGLWKPLNFDSVYYKHVLLLLSMRLCVVCVKLNHVLTVCCAVILVLAMVVFSICHRFFPFISSQTFWLFLSHTPPSLHLYTLFACTLEDFQLNNIWDRIQALSPALSSAYCKATRCMIMKHKLQTEVLYTSNVTQSITKFVLTIFFPSSIHAPPLAFVFSLFGFFLLWHSITFCIVWFRPLFTVSDFISNQFFSLFFVHCFL